MRFSLAPSLALRPWAPLLFSSCSRSSLARATVPALYPSGQCLSWLWQSPKALHSFVKPAPHQRTPLSDIKFYCVLFWCCPGRLFSWCRPGAVIPLRASSEHIALAGHGGLGSPGSPDRRARCDGGVLAARFMAFADGRGGGVSLPRAGPSRACCGFSRGLSRRLLWRWSIVTHSYTYCAPAVK